MASAPFDGALKKIQETKTISVAYRTDALPFSFEGPGQEPRRLHRRPVQRSVIA
jgi:hypothetical protein